MAVKDKTTLQAEIDAAITANGVGDITGPVLNTILDDIIDSVPNLVDDVAITGLRPYDGTVTYAIDDHVTEAGKVYKAIAGTTGAFDPNDWAEQGLIGRSNLTVDEIPIAKSANELEDSGWKITGADMIGAGKITGLTDPAAAQDAATKAYVDTIADGSLKPPEAYNPTTTGNYPLTYDGGAIKKADTFRITADEAGIGDGVRDVNIEDLLIALVDTPSATVNTDWMVAESNRDQASETVKGVAELATQAEADAETDDLRIVTPLKLGTWFVDVLTRALTWSGQLTLSLSPIFSALSASQTVETDGSKKLITVFKATAYNKSFGSSPGNVPQIVSALGNTEIVETNATGQLKTAAKATAYNKAFPAAGSAGTSPENEGTNPTPSRSDHEHAIPFCLQLSKAGNLANGDRATFRVPVPYAGVTWQAMYIRLTTAAGTSIDVNVERFNEAGTTQGNMWTAAQALGTAEFAKKTATFDTGEATPSQNDYYDLVLTNIAGSPPKDIVVQLRGWIPSDTKPE